MMRHSPNYLKGMIGRARVWCLAGAMMVIAVAGAGAQQDRTVAGTVVDSATRQPLAGAHVAVRGAQAGAVITDAQGRFLLRAGSGDAEIDVRRIGYDPRSLTVRESDTGTLTIAMQANVLRLTSVMVTAPSRAPGRYVDAPAAVSVVDPAVVDAIALTGQAPRVLETIPGVDVVHNGFGDFNINARGLNTTLNRRVLVLQDGRDLSLAFNGAQEWVALSLPLDDFKRIEMVRGPGSALYGANAYNGVLTFTTPLAREVVGTRVRVSGGGLGLVRADIRHAATFGSGRWAYKVALANSRSDTWTRSRTQSSDLEREYEDTGVPASELTVPPPGFEFFALAGQRKEGAPFAPGASVGDRDPIQATAGNLRLDRYFDGGATFTAEGGLARVAHETGVTALGRLQVGEAWRPWGRLAYDTPESSLLFYYSGRRSSDQLFLASGSEVDEESSIMHGEGQTSRMIWGGRARAIGGASARLASVQSRETLLGRDEEGRKDWSGALFGQLESDLTSTLQLVVSARADASQLHESQFSPRAAFVWSPTVNQSWRLSVGRAFQTPNVLEYFVNVPLAPDVDLSALEAGLRASPLGPALDNVPNGTLFTVSSAVPARALGNPSLDVERVTSYEAGYKTEWRERAFLAVDVYYSRLSQFVSDLLPGANPEYGPWMPPSTVPAEAAALVAAAVRGALSGAGQPLAAAGLSRLRDGRTAIIISIGNAGRAEGYGIEVAGGIEVSDRVKLDAAYAFSRTDIDESSLVAGDIILANTPRHKGHAAISISPTASINGRLSATMVARHPWASGLFAGDVPARQTVDADVAWHVRSDTELQVAVSNLLDQKRYQLVGGSVAGRMLVAGITVRF